MTSHEKTDIKEIVNMLLDFKGEKINQFCSRQLDQGVNPYEILMVKESGFVQWVVVKDTPGPLLLKQEAIPQVQNISP